METVPVFLLLFLEADLEGSGLSQRPIETGAATEQTVREARATQTERPAAVVHTSLTRLSLSSLQL